MKLTWNKFEILLKKMEFEMLLILTSILGFDIKSLTISIFWFLTAIYKGVTYDI